MTNEEAIKILQEKSLEYCEAFRFDCGNCDKCEVTIAYDMAIKVLEKQIPCNTVLETKEGYDIPVCSACGGDIYLMRGEANYCPNCGQALDWSDTK